MRSRPTVKLEVSPHPISPGDEVTFTAIITSEADTPCDEITFKLLGRERRSRPQSAMNGPLLADKQFRRAIVGLRVDFGGAILTAGKHTRSAVLEIPSDAPPTHESAMTEISYEFIAHIDIPWWPDKIVDRSLVVRLPARAIEERKRAKRFTSEANPSGQRPFLEASMESLDLVPGGRVEGVVAVSSIGDHRVERVDVTLVGVDDGADEDSADSIEIERIGWTVHEGAPAEGEPIRFTLEIPPAYTPDFVGDLVEVRHYLRVTAIVARRDAVEITIPVVMHPPGSTRETTSAPAVVGKGKLAANWEAAVAGLERADLGIVSIDEGGDHVVLTSAGRTLRVALEMRGEEGSFLVAHLAWPALGAELSIRAAQWRDFGGGVKLGNDLDERYVVRARDPEQARALLDGELSDALLGFDDVWFDDSFGRFAVRGTPHKRRALGTFLQRVVDLDGRMVDAFERVPPPRALASARDGYAAVASRAGARFHPGDMSIDGLVVSGIPMRVRQRMKDGEPTATCIEVPPLDGLHVTPGLLRELGAALGAEVNAASQVGEEASATAFEARSKFLDPVQLEGRVQELGARVRAAVDAAPRAPYR